MPVSHISFVPYFHFPDSRFGHPYFTILLESVFIPATRSFALGMESSPCRLERLDTDDPECDTIALSCPIFLWMIGYFIPDGRVVY